MILRETSPSSWQEFKVGFRSLGRDKRRRKRATGRNSFEMLSSGKATPRAGGPPEDEQIMLITRQQVVQLRADPS